MAGALDATGSVFDEDRLNAHAGDHQRDGIAAARGRCLPEAWAAVS